MTKEIIKKDLFLSLKICTTQSHNDDYGKNLICTRLVNSSKE
jgi:hypothetical protein